MRKRASGAKPQHMDRGVFDPLDRLHGFHPLEQADRDAPKIGPNAETKWAISTAGHDTQWEHVEEVDGTGRWGYMGCGQRGCSANKHCACGCPALQVVYLCGVDADHQMIHRVRNAVLALRGVGLEWGIRSGAVQKKRPSCITNRTTKRGGRVARRLRSCSEQLDV